MLEMNKLQWPYPHEVAANPENLPEVPAMVEANSPVEILGLGNPQLIRQPVPRCTLGGSVIPQHMNPVSTMLVEPESEFYSKN